MSTNIHKYRYVAAECVGMRYLHEIEHLGESEAFHAHLEGRVFQQLGAELRKHFEVHDEETDNSVIFTAEVYALTREQLTELINDAYARGRLDAQKEITEKLVAVQRESLL